MVLSMTSLPLPLPPPHPRNLMPPINAIHSARLIKWSTLANGALWPDNTLFSFCSKIPNDNGKKKLLHIGQYMAAIDELNTANHCQYSQKHIWLWMEYLLMAFSSQKTSVMETRLGSMRHKIIEVKKWSKQMEKHKVPLFTHSFQVLNASKEKFGMCLRNLSHKITT